MGDNHSLRLSGPYSMAVSYTASYCQASNHIQMLSAQLRLQALELGLRPRRGQPILLCLCCSGVLLVTVCKVPRENSIVNDSVYCKYNIIELEFN